MTSAVNISFVAVIVLIVLHAIAYEMPGLYPERQANNIVLLTFTILCVLFMSETEI